jgi:hypothetical protein
MNPEVAQAVPNTPEAEAILSGEGYKPVTFGGLVSALVEAEAIQTTDFEGIKTQVMGMLGLSDEVFIKFLHDTQPISKHTAETWAQEYKKKSEHSLRQEMFDETHEYFKTKLAKDITPDDQKRFQLFQEDVRADIEARREALGELDECGMPLSGSALRKKMELDTVHVPFLKKIERSTYVMNLIDLAERLKGDSMLLRHGAEFARSVLKDEFIHSRSIASLVDNLDMREFVDYWSDDPDTTIEAADVDRLQNIWLPESFIVEGLAAAYANAYYQKYNPAAPGRDEMRNLPNPIENICFITQDERSAFLSSYPLANGQKPRYR